MEGRGVHRSLRFDDVAAEALHSVFDLQSRFAAQHVLSIEVATGEVEVRLGLRHGPQRI